MSEFERGGIEDRASFPELGALDGDVGPALPLTPEALARFADQIEQRFALEQPRQPLRWRPRLVGRRFIVGGTLLAASAAAAMYSVNALRSERAPERADHSAAQVPDLPPPMVSAAPVPAAPHPEAGEPRENRPSTSPELAPPSSGRVQEAPSTPRAEVEPRSDDSKSRSGPPRSAAADRLAAANAMRSRHRYREAEALYLRVIELYPNSVAASVARVAAAEIRLEQFGDVDGAEHLYREAKTKGGELIAEAQFGLAQVFRARSDAAAERRALQDFVAHHPESPLVSAAQRRLQALGVP